MKKKKRVVIAMSGGVDSALAAFLLHKIGYECIGITMKLWDNEIFYHDNRGYCSLNTVEDARNEATNLNIPYYVLNFKKKFKEKIIDYFIGEYLIGRTPNPCIACNNCIKFGCLFQKAMDLEADYIATGHYVRKLYNFSTNRYELLKGIDEKKDQSYALYGIKQQVLKRCLFPLGEMTKFEVRKLAKKCGLTVAEKPDSQDICFIPNNNYKKFLQIHAQDKIKEGNFIDKNKKIIGKHKGIPYYTLGQRKGLGLNIGKPVFVSKINLDTNEVIIGEEEDLFSSELVASNVNWIMFEKLVTKIKAEIKIRYHSQIQPGTIYPHKDELIIVKFNNPQRAITPGQSVVFYENDKVIGGGIINSTNQ